MKNLPKISIFSEFYLMFKGLTLPIVFICAIINPTCPSQRADSGIENKDASWVINAQSEEDMENLEDNNLVKFKNITKKKESLFANFRLKGIKGGVNFSASISVDLSALELHPGDTLEKIIEECAKKAVKEFRKSEVQLENMVNISSIL